MRYAIETKDGVFVKFGDTPFPEGAAYPAPLDYQPPHYYKIVDGKVIEKTAEEKALKDAEIEQKRQDAIDAENARQEAIRLAPFSISKLKLKRAMVSLGKWEDFLNILKLDTSIYEDFMLSVTLMSDDPLVVQFKGVCMQMFSLTEEQINEMLKQCKSDIG